MTTNFNIGGTDVDQIFVSRAYFIERYPELAGTFKAAGLMTCGVNTNGVLGDNTTINKSSPIQTIAGGTNWRQISSTYTSVMATKTDGTLWGWGYSTTGELGNSSTINRSSPVQVVTGGTNWKQVSIGGSAAGGTTGAIKTDGTLWTWGAGSNGQLGNSSTTNRSSPIQTTGGGTNWKAVSSGGRHTAGIKTDGTLWIWGVNGLGQLGDNTVIARSSPVQTVAGGNNWKQVSLSSNAIAIGMSAAIKNDGTLWVWGTGDRGELGNEAITPRSSPIQTVSGGTNWKSVTAGYRQAGAIKTDGTLWMWGVNNFGQLGDNTTINKSSPIQTVAGGTNWAIIGQLSTSNSVVTAIKQDGTLWTWGNNINGGLGDNTRTLASSPIQTIAGGFNWISSSSTTTGFVAIRDFATDYLYTPSITPATQTISGTTGTAITASTAYTASYISNPVYSIVPDLPAGLSLNPSTGVISGTPTETFQPTLFTVTATSATQGIARASVFLSIGAALWLWGRNNYGQLGTSNLINRSSPVQTISGTSTWAQISSGPEHVGAIKNAGTAWLWGRNNYGQVGDGTTINRSSPVQTISGTSTWGSIATGDMYSGGIKTDGTLWMWGYNGWSQLGDNTFANKSSPVQTIAGGFNWKQVSVAGNFGNSTSAVKNDGTLWTWGRNNYGQLGNNTTIEASSPIQTIASGINWKQVSQGSLHTTAVKNDGTLWVWGHNDRGQLGDNTNINKSSPIQTVAAGTNWKQVAGGYYFTAAVKTDGTLWTWGANTWGQLGNNGYGTDISSPIQTIAGGTTWTQVTAGFNVSGAIKTDGTLWMWGFNNYGQSGNNTTTPFRQSSPVQTIASGNSWKQVSAGYAVMAIKQ